MAETLNELYYDPEHPAGYGGARRLKKYAKRKGVSKNAVDAFLKSEDTYTLHKPARKRFKTSAMKARSVDHTWQADITDLSHLKKYNDGFRYILFVIDVVSRYLWVKPLKTKTSKEVAQAFKDIMYTSQRFPALIHTDAGKEFEGEVLTYCRTLGIGTYVTGSPNKAAICERVQRTLKEKMYRYFTRHNTRRYLEVLDQLVSSYNHAYHRSIKMRPITVLKSKKMERKAMENLYGHLRTPKRFKFQKGDYVRISRMKDFTEKGYEPSWSREVFIISRVIKNHEPVPAYVLKDLMGDELKGSFNEEELQSVTYDENAEFLVEKVLRTEGKGAQKRMLVKFLGWPSKFNMYLNASQVRKMSV